MRIIRQEYSKSGRKWILDAETDFGDKPEYAENIINSHNWWRKWSSYYRVEKAYFSCGCRDWRMTSISPDKENKVVWMIDWDAE